MLDIATAIIGLATIATLVSNGERTKRVIRKAAKAFNPIPATPPRSSG